MLRKINRNSNPSKLRAMSGAEGDQIEDGEDVQSDRKTKMMMMMKFLPPKMQATNLSSGTIRPARNFCISRASLPSVLSEFVVF